MEDTITLRKWAALYITDQATEGWTRCSTNIDPSGFIRFTGVRNDWWITTDDNRSFSCTPDEPVWLWNPAVAAVTQDAVPVAHTPGPWTIYDDGTDEESSDIVMARKEDENYDICAIYPELPVAERKANARLIAAAPDMLAALENVVKYHRDNDSGSGELFGLDYVTTCIEAIRKAKGGNK